MKSHLKSHIFYHLCINVEYVHVLMDLSGRGNISFVFVYLVEMFAELSSYKINRKRALSPAQLYLRYVVCAYICIRPSPNIATLTHFFPKHGNSVCMPAHQA